VPVIPGTDVIVDADDARRRAEEIGFPVLVKASAGGGGRGIRVVASSEELPTAVSQARAEARASFGDDAVYLEKAVVDARHIEVQVLADGHGNVTHAGERDCSVQRRRQKLLEEAPAADLDPEVRREMVEAAMRLTGTIGYVGAGTIEFLVSGDSYYFMEMNTRIQVEHPISEVVTGADLVAEQLRIAAGDKLGFDGDLREPDGVAFEFRINAEDPDNDFFPSPGQLTRFDVPGGPGVRVETGFVAGDTVAPYYDSLLAKVVVHGRDREEALARSVQALTELRVEGVQTTRDVHLRLVRDSAVRQGPVTTAWLEDFLAG
jgi:acetyl-CoA carboxylase biotin carboxylase subunit